MKLVFLHGLGQTAKAWDRVIASLGDYDCLALELFDNGRLPDSYTVLEEKVRTILAAEKSDFLVVGLSLGASLAYSLLENPPQNLKGIIACAGQYKLLGNLPYSLQKWYFKLMPRSAFVKVGFDKKNLIQFYESMLELDLTNILEKSHLPVWSVCGQKDVFNLKPSRRVAEMVPNGLYQMIPDSGHLLTDEAPEELATVIRDFMMKF